MERWSRYVVLFALPDGYSAEAARTALAETMQHLPDLAIGQASPQSNVLANGSCGHRVPS